MFRFFCALQLFLLLALVSPIFAQTQEAHWELKSGFLHRRFAPKGLKEETTKWRFSRISWYPFIAWEEHRLRGSVVTEVWIDTPGKLRYMKTKVSRVLRMKAFKKGDRIPASLRPKGKKILWVILHDELVRKVFDGDEAIFEFRYNKDRIPIHPFVVTQELAKAGRNSRQVIFKTNNRTVLATLAKGRVTDLQIGWTTSEERFLLPDASKKPRKKATSSRKRTARKIAATKTRPKPQRVRYSSPTSNKKKKKLPPSIAAAQALMARGQAHPALVMLKKLARRYPNKEEVVYYEGRATFALGRLSEAAKYFDKARMMAPGWPLPVIASAELLAFRNRSVKALQLLEKLGTLTNVPEGLRVKATILASTRDFNGAMTTGKEALVELSSNADLLYVLARSAEGLGRDSQARDFYHQALHFSKGRRLSLLPHALLQHEVGKGKNSLQALALTPSKPVPLYFVTAFSLGTMEYLKGNLQEAARAFTQAHLSLPHDEAALYNCALVLAKLPGRQDEGNKLFKRLLALSPHHKKAKRRLAELSKSNRNKRTVSTGRNLLKYRGPSQLDMLFKRVKNQLDGVEDHKGQRGSTAPTINTPKLRSIELRTVEGKTKTVQERTLAPSRKALPEIRLGGRGGIAAPFGCVVRLEPQLDVPKQTSALGEDEVALSLVGRLACGLAQSVIIKVGFAERSGAKSRCINKTTIKAAEANNLVPIEIELRTIFASSTTKKPEFKIDIFALGKEGDKELLIDERAIRLRYDQELPKPMQRSQES